ncbi:MAG: hypothetical protein K8L99_08960 [Anaerolineae bacterium]|nr:hypothetical protein [Anaerolineae bacterium]
MHYADQRHTIAWTTVRRQRMLPDNAIGVVEAQNRQHVNLRDVVARGTVPSRYVFVDAMTVLKLRRAADLDDLMLVQIGDDVEEGQVLAGRSATRGRRVISPVTGILVYADEGRIIIQETPELMDLEAGLVGQVVDVAPGRGVIIEAYGALIQGVWGNGRRLIGPLRVEPEDGLEGIFDDSIDRQYSGSIVVTRRALKEASFVAIEGQHIGGVIAPSMDASLYQRALQTDVAIVLTQGFGDIRMNMQLYSLLEGFVGRQTTLDAFLPSRWESRRPEIFINLPVRAGERPPEPNTAQVLRPGLSVRLTRAPYVGSVGEIVDLPNAPQLMDNGLRVHCARVALVTGETALVPLANLEVFGR